MIRFDDLTILSYKLVYLNSLISISTGSTMSEEIADTATAIVIIPKSKNIERKRKCRTVWVKL